MKKVDVDKQQAISQEASVEAMPTFKAYKNGEEIESLQGADKDGLIALLNRAAGRNE